MKKNPAVKNLCYVESTTNGWMNENTTIDWFENVLKIFAFGKRRLFAWESCRAHLVESVTELLQKGKKEPVVISVTATGDIQAADVSWNKPIKDQLRKMYDQWMDEWPDIHTKGGNMRGHPLKQIVRWILKAWSYLDKEIIIKSFCCCALLIQDDRSEGKKLHIKLEKPLSSSLERFKAAMDEAAKKLVDPFTELDIKNDPDLVIDSEREEDEGVDIE